MYNFFSNRTKQRAFLKALKQVEDEGFYANLEADEDSMAVLPDLSRAVASLNGKPKTIKQQPETVNIEELESSLDGQRANPGKHKEDYTEFSRNDKSKFYQSLFSSSPTFLEDDKEDISEVEFLDESTEKDEVRLKVSTTAEAEEKVLDSRKRIFEKLANRNKVVQSDEPVKVEEKVEPKPVEKKPDKPAKLIVEVVAKPDKPKSEPVKKKTVKKSTTTKRKKKRKYDADISGGFNF